MTESKKAWVEPELIALVRNKSEEAVLAGCKESYKGSSNNTLYEGCGYTLNCMNRCMDWAAS